MKKHITLLFIGLITFVSASAQIQFAKDTVEKIYIDKANFEWASKVVLKNSSTDPADTVFTWEKENFINSPWETAICDQSLCYPPTDFTGELILHIGDSFTMKANFYPYDTRDCGSIKVHIASKLNPTTNLDSFYSEVCAFNTASIEKVNTAEVTITPNPTTDFIKVNTGSSKKQEVIIYTVLGNVVKKGWNNQNISVADLKPGVYIARVPAHGNVSKTFVKK